MLKVEMTYPRTATLADVEASKLQIEADWDGVYKVGRLVFKEFNDDGAVIIVTLSEVE